jgi:hypothetical protein
MAHNERYRTAGRAMLILLAGLLSVAVWRGFASGTRPARPVAQYERRILLGDVYAGQMVHGFLRIQNAGKGSLALQPAKKCSCLPIAIQDSQVSPGDSTLVSFSLKPVHQFGEIHEQLEIHTNDPVQPRIVVEIGGRISRGVEVQPYSVDFPYVNWGQTATRDVRLRCAEGGLRFISASASSERVRQELRQADAGGACLRISVQHPLAAGNLDEAVFVHTSDATFPYLIVPVHTQFPGPVRAFPASVLLRRPADSGKLTRKVELQATAPGTISVEVDPRVRPFVETSVTPGQSQDRYQLLITVDFAKTKGGQVSEVKVLFRDEDSRQHQLSIPLAMLD